MAYIKYKEGQRHNNQAVDSITRMTGLDPEQITYKKVGEDYNDNPTYEVSAEGVILGTITRKLEPRWKLERGRTIRIDLSPATYWYAKPLDGKKSISGKVSLIWAIEELISLTIGENVQ